MPRRTMAIDPTKEKKIPRKVRNLFFFVDSRKCATPLLHRYICCIRLQVLRELVWRAHAYPEGLELLHRDKWHFDSGLVDKDMRKTSTRAFPLRFSGA